MKFHNYFIKLNHSSKISGTSKKNGTCFYTNSKTKLSWLPNELSYTFYLVLFEMLLTKIFHEVRQFINLTQQLSKLSYTNSTIGFCFYIYVKTMDSDVLCISGASLCYEEIVLTVPHCTIPHSFIALEVNKRDCKN